MGILLEFPVWNPNVHSTCSSSCIPIDICVCMEQCILKTMEHTRNHSPWTTSKEIVLLAWLALLWNTATNTYCPAVGKLMGSKKNTSFITLQVKLYDGARVGWSVGSWSTGWYSTDTGVVTYQQAEMGRLQVYVCTVNMGEYKVRFIILYSL